MSATGTGIPTIVCPVCHHKKTPAQRDLICGNCIHHNTELIRNSVIENESRNEHMRAHIDSIFSDCREINEGNCQHRPEMGSEDGNMNTPPKHLKHPTHPTNSNPKEIPQPGSSSVCQLALHLQKLELMNRRIKSQGLQKSRDSLAKKNALLEAKIAALTSKIDENNQLFQSKEATMLEVYTRKLGDLDREIISVQQEGMRRVCRQAALKQYASYKVIRESFFSTRRTKDVAKRTEILFCSRPVLPISGYLDAQITTVNTFLEDLIRLQIILFELFKIDDDTLELPYLEYLRKLLPERSFYESVQSKINSILQRDDIAEEEDINKDESVLSDESQPEHISQDFEKITIKNNVIRVPKSFRTMNLQRRFSVKDTESPDVNSLGPGKKHSEGIKSAFVMVPQEHKIIEEELSPKSSAKPPSNPSKSSVEGTRKEAIASPKVNPQNSNGINPDLNGKKIVIVPHRILTKPFAKLRPNEYLKFISIVVKLLVTYNEFIWRVLGSPASKDGEGNGITVSSPSTSRIKMDGETEVNRRPFFNDFGEILHRIASMDHYFQQKPNLCNKLEESVQKVSRISHSIDASQMSNNTEEDRHLRDSWQIESTVPENTSPLSSFSKVKDLYTKLMSRAKGPEPSSEMTSVSDNIIYGMVSETTTTETRETPKRNELQQNTNNSTQKEGEITQSVQKEDTPLPDSFEYNLKEISRKVHDLMAGGPAGGGGRGRGVHGLHRLAKDRAGANSVMQQSRAHLEDWDVVSKMF